jgi:hypothetical protein
MFLNGMERAIAKRESIKQRGDGKDRGKRGGGNEKGDWRPLRSGDGRHGETDERETGREEQRGEGHKR